MYSLRVVSRVYRGALGVIIGERKITSRQPQTFKARLGVNPSHSKSSPRPARDYLSNIQCVFCIIYSNSSCTTPTTSQRAKKTRRIIRNKVPRASPTLVLTPRGQSHPVTGSILVVNRRFRRHDALEIWCQRERVYKTAKQYPQNPSRRSLRA